MNKHIRFLTLIAAIVLVFSACSGPGIEYKDDTVTVKQVEPAAEKTYKTMEWIRMTEEDAFSGTLIIAKGKVTKLRDVEVSYADEDGFKDTELMALFDFEVSEYLLNTTDLGDKKILTVGHPSDSSTRVQDEPVMAEGKEFILFLRLPSYWKPDAEDAMKRASFMDVHIAATYQLVFEKVDDVYTIPSWLADTFSSTDKESFTKNVQEVLKERGSSATEGFLVKCETAEKIIKETAARYQ